MFDYVCVFTTGGVMLWQKNLLPDFNLSLINLFVKTCLLEENYSRESKKFTHLDHSLKWQMHPSVKLVFLVVYKEILQLAFVEQLLDMMAKAFIGSVLPSLSFTDGVFYLGS